MSRPRSSDTPLKFDALFFVQLPAKSKERRRSSLGPRAKADALRNISNTAEKKKREKQSHPRKSLSKRCACSACPLACCPRA